MPLSKKKIGIVCPYGWDTPGGVQSHVGDLAEYLIRQGHHVSVLAPAIDDEKLPDYVTSAGRPISIPYNGAVARILFGPIAFSRVRQWIQAGDFDVLHLHEPAIPSISLLACWAAEGPMVGTFHAAAKRQKVSFAVVPFLEPVIEKLTARIAVSEAARETLREHLETDAIVVPNGIYASRYSDAHVDPRWTGNTLGFMGRFEEKRKGLDILIAALPTIISQIPDLRIFVAGPGDSKEVLKDIDPYLRDRFSFLGRISESEKADFLASVGLYIAPNTGGESFGIILAEALAAGASVIASDIPAFDSLLGHGDFGTLFTSEDPADLARQVIALLQDEPGRRAIAERGKIFAQNFDWEVVAEKIYDVYEMAMVGGNGVSLLSENRAWNRFLGRQQ
ncbi:MAG: glycosyltransferase family 4 protein [Candidatus Planktophila sp.]|jgi:phosphatidyl-myo-inositol alpha-mannosyltransferase|tara:strand:+ start:6496 stop:7671 length:1176 start_codon:yes stop_codon:yes gene_type:complete